MSAEDEAPIAAPTTEQERPVLREMIRGALSSALFAGLVGGGLYLLGEVARTYAARLDERQRNDEAPDEIDEAAALLGVARDASADEIRAALRAKLADSQIDPDQGGDGDEATRLIAAKNLLVEHARSTETA